MYSLIVIGSLLLFVVSEKTFIHFSRTARRAFWYVLSCAIFLWVVKWLQALEGLGMAWLMVTAILAASVVEDEYRKKTGLTPMDIEATRLVRQRFRSPIGQGHSERIMDIVNAITRGKGYTAGTKQLVSRVSGATRRLQKGLHRIIISADREELNFIICSVNVPAVLEVANSKTIKMLVGRLGDLETVSRAAIVDGLQKIGLRHRRQRQEWARDVIVQTKGLQLTYFKAYIDDGGDYHSMYKLMYNDLQWDIRDQVMEHIRSEGAQLLNKLDALDTLGPKPAGIVLKILSDVDDTIFSSGGSFPAGVDARYPRKTYYPGVLALYSAIDRQFARKNEKILRDLELIGNPVKDSISERSISGSISASKASTPLEIPQLRVQTSQEVIHHMPPNSPEYYMLGDLMTPRDTSNFTSLTHLSNFNSCLPVDHQEGSNLVLLSARPESYKGLTESESYRKYFQPLVERGDLGTSPTMLLGSLDSGPRALFKLFFGGSNSNAPENLKSKTATDALYQTLASKKLSRFREYASLYPEAAFVYVGDNGQGDVLCAEALANSREFKRKIVASFIHKVAGTMSTLSIFRKEDSTSHDIQEAWRMRGIHLNRTHLGMSKTAYELNLISVEDLKKICTSAMGEYLRISSRYGGRHAGRNLSKVATNDLNPDVLVINQILASKGLEPVPQAAFTEEDEGEFQNEVDDKSEFYNSTDTSAPYGKAILQ